MCRLLIALQLLRPSCEHAKCILQIGYEQFAQIEMGSFRVSVNGFPPAAVNAKTNPIDVWVPEVHASTLLLHVRFRSNGKDKTWSATAYAEKPVKTVSMVINKKCV